MKFYLGTHEVHWLGLVDVPLFVSRRRLAKRQSWPRATCSWALDSGGFTELNRPGGRWTISVEQYVAEVRRWSEAIGEPDWVAPMDHMCEPQVLKHTGATVREHQARTLVNYLELREHLGDLVVPVLQGWTPDDYQRHADDYELAGVDLAAVRTVGVGSVCRRQSLPGAGHIFGALQPLGLRLHGFGVKKTGLAIYGDALASADSMAWSADARQTPRRMPGHTHKNCANCREFALLWRRELMDALEKMPQAFDLWPTREAA